MSDPRAVATPVLAVPAAIGNDAETFELPTRDIETELATRKMEQLP